MVGERSSNRTRNKLLNLPAAMNLYWQYMPLSSIFGQWAGKLLSFVERLFLVSNICGTPFPQTFTIFWQVSQMWLTWAYWMEREKQSVVFTRNANMTFFGWRQPLFPSHGRGNKTRLIFIISIKHPYSLVFWHNALVRKSCWTDFCKNPIFSLLISKPKGKLADGYVPVPTPCVTFCNEACLSRGFGSALGSCSHLGDGSYLFRGI